jgi:triosephosphate isomerase
MNLLPDQAELLVQDLISEFVTKPDLEVVIFPPTALLPFVRDWVLGSSIRYGAQNCWHEVSGAFTGETSSELLKALGCNFCLVGHSERREIFNESNKLVGLKTQALIKVGVTPIVCVGESLNERETGIHFRKIKDQVESVFALLDKASWLRLVFAYEPVWAIGTGKTATPEQAEEIHHYIRNIIKDLAGESLAEGIGILYGGSAKPANAAELLRKENIDGLLVGGASLKAEEFLKIISAY